MKLIPKYQNEGLVTRQDNTYVAKPTIPPKLIKRTYTPTQSYVSGKESKVVRKLTRNIRNM